MRQLFYSLANYPENNARVERKRRAPDWPFLDNDSLSGVEVGGYRQATGYSPAETGYAGWKTLEVTCVKCGIVSLVGPVACGDADEIFQVIRE